MTSRGEERGRERRGDGGTSPGKWAIDANRKRLPQVGAAFDFLVVHGCGPCYGEILSFAVGNDGAGYGPAISGQVLAQKSGGPSLSGTRLLTGRSPRFR